MRFSPDNLVCGEVTQGTPLTAGVPGGGGRTRLFEVQAFGLLGFLLL
jgi:hypothetical protein